MSMRAKMWWVAGLFTLLAIGVVAGIGASVYALELNPGPVSATAEGTATTPQGTVKHVTLTLQTFPHAPTQAWEQEHNYHPVTSPYPPLNIHTTWVRYGPTTNFVIPTHALVTIRVENYTNPMLLLNSFYRQVHGTVNSTAMVDGKTFSELPANDVSHTFTVHSIPSAQQPWLFVSVPVAALPTKIAMKGADYGFAPHPRVTEFSFMTDGPGTYVWQCFVGCGIAYDGWGGPMDTPGFMSGQITVK